MMPKPFMMPPEQAFPPLRGGPPPAQREGGVFRGQLAVRRRLSGQPFDLVYDAHQVRNTNHKTTARAKVGLVSALAQAVTKADPFDMPWDKPE
eukprot:10301380-Heterocapsa_arctica.AAC.1